jgi:hypothetical protein
VSRGRRWNGIADRPRLCLEHVGRHSRLVRRWVSPSACHRSGVDSPARRPDVDGPRFRKRGRRTRCSPAARTSSCAGFFSA